MHVTASASLTHSASSVCQPHLRHYQLIFVPFPPSLTMNLVLVSFFHPSLMKIFRLIFIFGQRLYAVATSLPPCLAFSLVSSSLSLAQKLALSFLCLFRILTLSNHFLLYLSVPEVVSIWRQNSATNCSAFLYVTFSPVLKLATWR